MPLGIRMPPNRGSTRATRGTANTKRKSRSWDSSGICRRRLLRNRSTAPSCSTARSLLASKLDAVQKRWRRLVVTVSERRCSFRCSTGCACEAAAAFFRLTLSRRSQSARRERAAEHSASRVDELAALCHPISAESRRSGHTINPLPALTNFADVCGTLRFSLLLQRLGKSAQRRRQCGRQEERLGETLLGILRTAGLQLRESQIHQHGWCPRGRPQRCLKRLPRAIVIAKSVVGEPEQIGVACRIVFRRLR